MALVPIFHGEITEDGAFVADAHEADQRKNYLRFLRGQRVEFVIRKARTKRSEDQNKYLHAVPLPLLAAEWGEDIETAKLLILGECFGWKETRNGRQLPLKPHTSGLTVEEFSHLIEWLPPWAMVNFGVNIPLPNEAEAA
jgi:hypothetical protein